MPLCPQITNTPITVVQNADFTVSNVVPVVVANTQQVAVVQQSAADAYAEAVAAGTAASTAQTTANGKNKVTYSTSTPGSTANTVGDIWYQYGTAAPNVGRIIAQYMGAGGTSWTQTTVSGLVVANIDAGSITTGTLSVGLGITTGTGTFTVNALTGALFADSATITGTITGSTITGGTVQTSSGNDAIILNSALNALQFKVANAISGNVVPLGAAGVLMHYGATPDPTGSTFPKVQMSFSSALLQGSSNYYVQSTNAGNSALGDFRMFNNLTIDGELTAAQRVVFDSGVIRFPNIGGITGGTNMRFDTSTGRVYYLATSSRTVKDNIVDISEVPGLEPKLLLDLPIRAFTYKPGQLVDTDDRVDVMVPGFIAEELDQIYPVATDYADGPLSWNDRFLIPGMLALIQDLYKEIATLKGE